MVDRPQSPTNSADSESTSSEPLGLKNPLQPVQPLMSVNRKFLVPLGVRSLSILDLSLFQSSFIQADFLDNPFLDSPFFDIESSESSPPLAPSTLSVGAWQPQHSEPQPLESKVDLRSPTFKQSAVNDSLSSQQISLDQPLEFTSGETQHPQSEAIPKLQAKQVSTEFDPGGVTSDITEYQAENIQQKQSENNQDKKIDYLKNQQPSYLQRTVKSESNQGSSSALALGIQEDHIDEPSKLSPQIYQAQNTESRPDNEEQPSDERSPNTFEEPTHLQAQVESSQSFAVQHSSADERSDLQHINTLRSQPVTSPVISQIDQQNQVNLQSQDNSDVTIQLVSQDDVSPSAPLTTTADSNPAPQINVQPQAQLPASSHSNLSINTSSQRHSQISDVQLSSTNSQDQSISTAPLSSDSQITSDANIPANLKQDQLVSYQTDNGIQPQVNEDTKSVQTSSYLNTANQVDSDFQHTQTIFEQTPPVLSPINQNNLGSQAIQAKSQSDFSSDSNVQAESQSHIANQVGTNLPNIQDFPEPAIQIQPQLNQINLDTQPIQALPESDSLIQAQVIANKVTQSTPESSTYTSSLSNPEVQNSQSFSQAETEAQNNVKPQNIQAQGNSIDQNNRITPNSNPQLQAKVGSDIQAIPQSDTLTNSLVSPDTHDAPELEVQVQPKNNFTDFIQATSELENSSQLEGIPDSQDTEFVSQPDAQVQRQVNLSSGKYQALTTSETQVNPVALSSHSSTSSEYPKTTEDSMPSNTISSGNLFEGSQSQLNSDLLDGKNPENLHHSVNIQSQSSSNMMVSPEHETSDLSTLNAGISAQSELPLAIQPKPDIQSQAKIQSQSDIQSETVAKHQPISQNQLVIQAQLDAQPQITTETHTESEARVDETNKSSHLLQEPDYSDVTLSDTIARQSQSIRDNSDTQLEVQAPNTYTESVRRSNPYVDLETDINANQQSQASTIKFQHEVEVAQFNHSENIQADLEHNQYVVSPSSDLQIQAQPQSEDSQLTIRPPEKQEGTRSTHLVQSQLEKATPFPFTPGEGANFDAPIDNQVQPQGDATIDSNSQASESVRSQAHSLSPELISIEIQKKPQTEIELQEDIQPQLDLMALDKMEPFTQVQPQLSPEIKDSSEQISKSNLTRSQQTNESQQAIDSSTTTYPPIIQASPELAQPAIAQLDVDGQFQANISAEAQAITAQVNVQSSQNMSETGDQQYNNQSLRADGLTEESGIQSSANSSQVSSSVNLKPEVSSDGASHIVESYPVPIESSASQLADHSSTIGLNFQSDAESELNPTVRYAPQAGIPPRGVEESAHSPQLFDIQAQLSPQPTNSATSQDNNLSSPNPDITINSNSTNQVQTRVAPESTIHSESEMNISPQLHVQASPSSSDYSPIQLASGQTIAAESLELSVEPESTIRSQSESGNLESPNQVYKQNFSPVETKVKSDFEDSSPVGSEYLEPTIIQSQQISELNLGAHVNLDLSSSHSLQRGIDPLKSSHDREMSNSASQVDGQTDNNIQATPLGNVESISDVGRMVQAQSESQVNQPSSASLEIQTDALQSDRTTDPIQKTSYTSEIPQNAPSAHSPQPELDSHKTEFKSSKVDLSETNSSIHSHRSHDATLEVADAIVQRSHQQHSDKSNHLSKTVNSQTTDAEPDIESLPQVWQDLTVLRPLIQQPTIQQSATIPQSSSYYQDIRATNKVSTGTSINVQRTSIPEKGLDQSMAHDRIPDNWLSLADLVEQTTTTSPRSSSHSKAISSNAKADIPKPATSASFHQITADSNAVVQAQFIDTPPVRVTRHHPPMPIMAKKLEDSNSIADAPDHADTPDNTDYLEAVAQAIYQRLRQRLRVEQERHGRDYFGRLPW